MTGSTQYLVGRSLRSSLSSHPRMPSRPLQRLLATSSSSPAQPSYRLQGFLVLSLLSASVGLFVWERRTPGTAGGTSRPAESGTFTLRLSNGRAGVQEFTFPRKPEAAIEAILHENETSQTIGRKGNPVVRWDRNWVGSNEPSEDRSAIDLIARGSNARASSPGLTVQEVEQGEGSRDIVMFSMLDGHAGDATSKLLAKALHPTLGLALASLQAGHPFQQGAHLKTYAEYFNPLAWIRRNEWTPANVMLSIQNAFLQLDENICQTPLRLLPSLSAQDSKSNLPTTGQIFTMMAGPANAGAVAVSTIVDVEKDDLYVAVTGDCRAVAGWQDTEGKWRCDVLSEDQMGENPKEINRMRSEHPPSERETVIRAGRVQGGLQPTRAFGDAVYKWTAQQYAQVAAAYQAEGERVRPQRPGSFTPPYVTARPEVEHRKINPMNGEKLRFVIMATDGLWDRITSEEATLLVASYLSHPTHSDVPKSELPKAFPLLAPPENRLYPAEDLPGTNRRCIGSWAFEGDENAATHLIRNSLAGADKRLRGELLSMHGEIVRAARDDITVTVIFFDGTR